MLSKANWCYFFMLGGFCCWNANWADRGESQTIAAGVLDTLQGEKVNFSLAYAQTRLLSSF